LSAIGLHQFEAWFCSPTEIENNLAVGAGPVALQQAHSSVKSHTSLRAVPVTQAARDLRAGFCRQQKLSFLSLTARMSGSPRR
jgi:hypothetical protein